VLLGLGGRQQAARDARAGGLLELVELLLLRGSRVEEIRGECHGEVLFGHCIGAGLPADDKETGVLGNALEEGSKHFEDVAVRFGKEQYE